MTQAYEEGFTAGLRNAPRLANPYRFTHCETARSLAKADDWERARLRAKADIEAALAKVRR